MSFTKIVCGIDGNAPALEGVRQAAALAEPGATLELVAISDEWPEGTTSTQARPLRREMIDDALARARAELEGSSFEVVERPLDNQGGYAWERLLREAKGADLVVVGRRALTRLEGVMLHSVVPNVVHRAELPVLVAVKPPDNQPFPGRILVAADGPGHPEDAVRMASEIAAHSPGSDVILLRASKHARARQPAVAAAAADLTAATGSDPIDLAVDGEPHRAIVDYAKAERASLVLTGSRALHAVKAAGSVSERVAQDSPCSVLVVRGPEQPLRGLPYA